MQTFLYSIPAFILFFSSFIYLKITENIYFQIIFSVLFFISMILIFLKQKEKHEAKKVFLIVFYQTLYDFIFDYPLGAHTLSFLIVSLYYKFITGNSKKTINLLQYLCFGLIYFTIPYLCNTFIFKNDTSLNLLIGDIIVYSIISIVFYIFIYAKIEDTKDTLFA